QAEDGIRGFHVTGVQTCALPICPRRPVESEGSRRWGITRGLCTRRTPPPAPAIVRAPRLPRRIRARRAPRLDATLEQAEVDVRHEQLDEAERETAQERIAAHGELHRDHPEQRAGRSEEH